MGTVDCNIDQELACCCAAFPTTSKPAAAKPSRTKKGKKGSRTKSGNDMLPMRLQKPPLKQLKKAFNMDHSKVTDDAKECNSCVKSRKYLDYLAKTLEALRQMNLGSGCNAAAACGAGPLSANANDSSAAPAARSDGVVSKPRAAKRRKRTRKRYPVLAPPR